MRIFVGILRITVGLFVIGLFLKSSDGGLFASIILLMVVGEIFAVSRIARKSDGDDR